MHDTTITPAIKNVLPLHISDLLALGFNQPNSGNMADDLPPPPADPEPAAPDINLMDLDLPPPSGDQELLMPSTGQEQPGAVINPQQETKQRSPGTTQENIPLDERVSSPNGLDSRDKENATQDEKQPLKEQTSNPGNPGHTYSKSASGGSHAGSASGLPRHRHACIICGCPACCCHRKMIVFWVILFLMLQVVPVGILILDGIYSSRHGHTYSR